MKFAEQICFGLSVTENLDYHQPSTKTEKMETVFHTCKVLFSASQTGSLIVDHSRLMNVSIRATASPEVFIIWWKCCKILSLRISRSLSGPQLQDKTTTSDRCDVNCVLTCVSHIFCVCLWHWRPLKALVSSVSLAYGPCSHYLSHPWTPSSFTGWGLGLMCFWACVWMGSKDRWCQRKGQSSSLSYGGRGREAGNPRGSECTVEPLPHFMWKNQLITWKYDNV